MQLGNFLNPNKAILYLYKGAILGVKLTMKLCFVNDQSLRQLIEK